MNGCGGMLQLIVLRPKIILVIKNLLMLICWFPQVFCSCVLQLHFVELFSEQSVHVVYLAFSDIALIRLKCTEVFEVFIALDFSTIQ